MWLALALLARVLHNMTCSLSFNIAVQYVSNLCMRMCMYAWNLCAQFTGPWLSLQHVKTLKPEPVFREFR